jgi:beta-barrel assembly-enhancing protease
MKILREYLNRFIRKKFSAEMEPAWAFQLSGILSTIQGFVGLMEMLNSMNKHKPSSTQILFSTHPMSSERLSAVVQRNSGQYASSKGLPLERERYMDKIASLRAKRQAIELPQKGEAFLAKKNYNDAQNSFKKALDREKNDYSGHVLMSKCMLLHKKPASALSFAKKATQIYPTEAWGFNIVGLASSELKQYDQAYQNYKKCDELLTGNPKLSFCKGYALDKMGGIKQAANNYMKYLEMIQYQPRKYSQYAFKRLKAWGYAK